MFTVLESELRMNLVRSTFMTWPIFIKMANPPLHRPLGLLLLVIKKVGQWGDWWYHLIYRSRQYLARAFTQCLHIHTLATQVEVPLVRGKLKLLRAKCEDYPQLLACL